MLNILLTNKITNNVPNTTNNKVLDQENQDYYNQSNQQHIACKHDNGLERVTLELATDVILKEEEYGFHK